jgi:hypothetical protein
MFIRTCLGLLLLVPILAWTQTDTNGTDTNGSDTNGDPVEAAPLRTPPPVSGAAYSTEFASETQSNNLRIGLTFGTAYSSNVQGGSNPVSDISYSIWPTLAFDAATTRTHWDVSYAPGFTFYQHTSSLNQGNQNLTADFQYRLTPHMTVSLRDCFQKTSNPFNQPNPDAAISVSGSSPPPNVAVIAPYADQVRNIANAEITYQLSANGMVGVSGTFTNLHYPDPEEVPNLYNSSSAGGSVFYSRRFLSKYYVGASYQYQDVLAYQAGTAVSTQTLTQTIFGFCTFYLKPTLSLSVSGGPQHSYTTDPPLPASRSWSPMLMASLSWRGQRTSLAASYARVVTGGGGLVGSYHSNIANVSGGWQLSRNWSVGLSASYSLYSTLIPFFPGSNSGGKTVSVTASAQRPLGEHFSVGAGFTRLQQGYPEVPTISAIPDTNRAFVSISYQFARPLKR